MIQMEPTELMETSRKIGKQVAEKFFKGPNDRIHDSTEPGGAEESLAHLLESELAALVALGAELAFKTSERARDDYDGNQPGGVVAYAEAELKRGVR